MQLVQQLATAPDQGLAAGQALLGVGIKGPGQLHQGLALGWGDTPGIDPQLPSHKGMKAFATPLEILKAALGLQLKGLLQGAQPGLQR
jgi:hypothetical protein